MHFVLLVEGMDTHTFAREILTLVCYLERGKRLQIRRFLVDVRQDLIIAEFALKVCIVTESSITYKSLQPSLRLEG